ncbi:MAG: hypothetical protein D8M57_02300 [Candidatus Scalindua sp. AMX11]|nr:MAG: hypothetical protein DWQ00_19305 [Candidatus Scalindua sp.]NOG84739.1 hypothetical protein [Planctomycetota bacterium]RZV98345.1 MAG: hypothetical protein EX341_01210 [Candidatus Scalindua sp. SCAELEC01]TDE66562.1 MAG: hypothetical protein D8M57_02300 [Candidatus Scalindua sp. AMX11]
MLVKSKDEEKRSLSLVQCVSMDHKNHVNNVFVTICAWCKRIRDDEGFWHKTIEFCSGDSGEKITHGICQECMRKERLVLAKKN